MTAAAPSCYTLPGGEASPLGVALLSRAARWTRHQPDSQRGVLKL